MCLNCLTGRRTAIPRSSAVCCFRFELRTFTESLESLAERTVAASRREGRPRTERFQEEMGEPRVPLKIFLTLPRGECVHQLIAKCQLGNRAQASKGAKMSMVISTHFNETFQCLVKYLSFDFPDAGVTFR